jgi:hypothetical protein
VGSRVGVWHHTILWFKNYLTCYNTFGIRRGGIAKNRTDRSGIASWLRVICFLIWASFLPNKLFLKNGSSSQVKFWKEKKRFQIATETSSIFLTCSLFRLSQNKTSIANDCDPASHPPLRVTVPPPPPFVSLFLARGCYLLTYGYELNLMLWF